MEGLSPLLGYFALMILPVFLSASIILLANWTINALVDFVMGLWK